MAKTKTYKVGNEVYDIPENETQDFLSSFKDAVEVESYLVGKDTFDIPLAEIESFKVEFPNAEPLKKKVGTEPTAPKSGTGGTVGDTEAQSIGSEGGLFAPLQVPKMFAEKELKVKETPAPKGKYTLEKEEQTANVTRDDILKNINNEEFLKGINSGEVKINIQDDDELGNLLNEKLSFYKAQPIEPKVATQEDIDFWESAGNSIKNVVTTLKGFFPRADVLAADVYENILGKEIAQGFYKWTGADIDKTRNNAYAKLAELEKQMLPTRGLVESAQKKDLKGIAAGTVDAITAIFSTALPSLATGGAGLVTEMLGGTVVDYNNIKAEEQGISVEELYQKGDAELATPMIIGSAAVGLESIGLKGIGRYINQNIRRVGTKRIADLFLTFKKEALTEWTQTGLEEANKVLAKGGSVDDASRAAADVMLSEKGLESYLKGGVGASSTAIAGRFIKGKYNAITKKNKEQTDKLQKEAEVAKQIANNPSVSKEAKQAVSKEVQETEAAINEIQKQEINAYNSIEDKTEIDNLINEKNRLETIIRDESITEEQKQVFSDKLNQVNTQIDNIFNEKLKEVEKLVDEQIKEVEKEKIADLAQRISKGEKIESAEDLQLQQNFPKQLEAELARIKANEPTTTVSEPIQQVTAEPDPQVEEGVTETVSEGIVEDSGGGAKATPAVLSSVEETAKALEDKKTSLDEKAKKLGYIGIKQFNAQNQLREDLNAEEKELLKEYSDFQQEVKNLKDESVISKLNDDEFSSWSKANDITRDDLGKVVKDEELELAAKRIRILNARGDVNKAESELKKLRESKKKDNWTVESWKERFDEDISQLEIDEINESNKAFNEELDRQLVKAVEELLTPKTEQDAVQEQAAGQVPIQPEARISEEVEEGTPEAKPKEPTEEGKEKIINIPIRENKYGETIITQEGKSVLNKLIDEYLENNPKKTSDVKETETLSKEEIKKQNEILSKAKTGKPIKVRIFHGTRNIFTRLSKDFLGNFTNSESAKKAFFLTASPQTASTYAGTSLSVSDYQKEIIRHLESITNLSYEDVFDLVRLREDTRNESYVISADVELKNPLVVDNSLMAKEEIDINTAIEQAIKNGHDGVIFINTPDAFATYREDFRGNHVAIFNEDSATNLNVEKIFNETKPKEVAKEEEVKPKEDEKNEQEPVIKAVERKAESDNEVELNEAVGEADQLIQEGSGESANIRSKPIAELKTDEKNFQGRTAKYAKRSVLDILGNFNMAALDPIRFWKNDKGEDVVLAGHSRKKAFEIINKLSKGEVLTEEEQSLVNQAEVLYGKNAKQIVDDAKRQGFKEGFVPKAEEFKGTLAEAKDFALKSNAKGTAQTPFENSKVIAQMRKDGATNKEIENALNELAQRGDKEYTDNLSRLDAKGLAATTLEQADTNPDKVGEDNLKKIREAANTTGKMRKMFPQLTRLHEDEIFSAILNGKVKASEVADRVNRVVNSLTDPFDPNNKLNIEQISNVSPQEAEFNNKTNDLKNEIRDLQASIKKNKDTGLTPIEQDLLDQSITKNNGNIEAGRKEFEGDFVQGLVKKKTDEAKALIDRRQKQLQDHLSTKKDLKGQGASLFDMPMPEQSPKEIANKSLIDQIQDLKIKGGGKTGALMLAPKLWNGFLDVVIAGLKAGEVIGNAVKKGIDWLNSQGVTDVEPYLNELEIKAKEPNVKQAVRKLIPRKPTEQKRIDKAASIGEGLGFIAGEITGIKKGIKEGAIRHQDAIKNITDLVKDAFNGKTIDGKTYKSIINRIGNAKTPLQIERAMDYIERVADDASYIEALTDVNNMQSKAKALSKQKNIPINHKQVLEGISKIDTDLIDDLAKFRDRLNDYMRNFLPITNPNYKPADSAEMLSYLDNLQKETDTKYEKQLKNLYGIESEGLSAKEIMDAIEAEDIDEYMSNMSETKRNELSKLLTKLAEYAKLGLDTVSIEGLTEKEKTILEKIKNIPIEKLSNNQKKEFTKVADNISLNRKFFGAEKIAALSDALLGMPKALSDAKGIKVRKALNVKGLQLEQQIFSISDMFRNFFGIGEAMAKVQNDMGMGKLIMGQRRYVKEMKKAQLEISDFFNKLKKKYKDFNSKENKIAEGMASYLIQPVPNQDEPNSFQIRKDIIFKDLQEKSKYKETTEQSNIGMEVFSKLEKAKNNKELFDILKKEYPSAFETINFYKNTLLPKYKEQIQQHQELFFNNYADWSNEEYLPIAYTKVPGEKIKDEKEQYFQTSSIPTPKQSPNTIRRSAYTTLPKDRLINYNLRANVFNGLSKNMYDLNTAYAWQQMKDFMGLPDAEILFGGKDNVNFVNKKLNNLRSKQQKTGVIDSDEFSKTLEGMSNVARRYAVSALLGGVFQAPKQMSEQVVSAAINNNFRFDKIGKNMLDISQARELLDKFGIGGRKEIRGGTTYDNAIESGSSAMQQWIGDGKAIKAKEVLEKLEDIWMKSLTQGDYLAASSAWMTFYESYLNKKGIDISDWRNEANLVDTDPIRMDAAIYAETMTDITQVSSDTSKLADISKKGSSGYENVIKTILLPFSTFAVQMRARMINDAKDFFAFSDMEGRSRVSAGKSLLATMAGMAAFHSMNIYLLGMVKDNLSGLILNAFGIDDTEDEEEAKKQAAFKFKMFYSNMMRDLVASGFGQIAENGFIDAMNWTAFMILSQLDDPSTKKKNGETMDYKYWKSKTEKTPFYRYGQWEESAFGLGLYDFVLEKPKDLYLQGEKIASDEIEDKYKPLILFASISEMLHSLRLNDADVNRIIQQAQKKAIKKSKEGDSDAEPSTTKSGTREVKQREANIREAGVREAGVREIK